MATAQDRITIYGPKDARTEAAVIRHFQAKMPYGWSFLM